MKKKSIKDRFWEKVEKGGDDDCWLWQGAISDNYGRLIIDGKAHLSHRISKMLDMGLSHPDEIKLQCLHSCDVPLCVNPAHIFTGTHADNMADRNAKNRQRGSAGERNGNSKLDSQKIILIRWAFKAGVSRRFLSSVFGVSTTNISHIVNMKTWRHIL